MVSWSWTANVPTRPPTGKGIISDPLLSKAGKWLVVFNADSAMRILCSLSQDHCFVYVSSYLLFEANLAFPEIFRIPPKILPQWKFTAPAFSTRGHMGTEKVKQKMFLRKKCCLDLLIWIAQKLAAQLFLEQVDNLPHPQKKNFLCSSKMNCIFLMQHGYLFLCWWLGVPLLQNWFVMQWSPSWGLPFQTMLSDLHFLYVNCVQVF